MNEDDAATDAQRRELQRRVFSATSEAADARVAARQLQQLDARRLQVTLESESPPAPKSPNLVSIPRLGDLASAPFTIARFAAAVALALAIGVGVGLSAAERPDAVSESAASRTVVDARGALALFDRSQVAADRPAQSLPATVVAESVRAIGDPFFQLYIGRNAADMACLFAAQPESSFAMSCVPVDEFPSTGVRLEWSSEMESISSDGARGVIPSAMRATWRPDGSLDLAGSPR